MSHATDALEAAIGNALFLGQPFPAITQWTVHLFTILPNEAGEGGSEPNAAYGYQPVRCDPGPDRWMKDSAQQSGATVYRNKIPVQLTVASSGWGAINGFGLKDQNGQLQYVATLTTARTITSGEQPVFLAGELAFTIG